MFVVGLVWDALTSPNQHCNARNESAHNTKIFGNCKNATVMTWVCHNIYQQSDHRNNYSHFPRYKTYEIDGVIKLPAW